MTIDLNTTLNDDEKKKQEEEKQSLVEKVSSMTLEIKNQIQSVWMTNFCFAVSLVAMVQDASLERLGAILKIFYGCQIFGQLVLLILQPK